MTVSLNATSLFNSSVTPSAPLIEGTAASSLSASSFDTTTSVTGRYGMRITFPSALNLSSYDYVSFFVNSTQYDPQGASDTIPNGGWRVVFVDGSGNYSGYNIYGSGVPNYSAANNGFQDGFFVSYVGTDNTWFIHKSRTPDISAGTINLSDIVAVEVTVKTTSNSRKQAIFSRMTGRTPISVTGTETLDSIRTAAATATSSINAARLVQRIPFYQFGASGIIYSAMLGLSIGNGSTATNWTDENFQLGFENTYDKSPTHRSTGPWLQLDNNNTRELTINQSASDTLALTDFTIASAGYWQWVLSGSGSATCIRGQFWRFDEFVAAHGTYTDCAWNEGEAAVVCTASTVITRGTVRNGVGHGIQITGAAGTYSNLDIDFDNNSTYDIELGSGGAGTYTLGNIAVIGSYTLKIRNNSATNAIVVEIPSGITYSTSTAGGSISVSVPTVTADISIVGMPDASGASCRLQIFNASAVSAAAWQAATPYSAGDMVLRTTGVGTESTAGLYMRCTTGGTSGGTEPTWNTTPGGTTTDNSVTWTTYKVLFHDADPASTSYSTTYIDGEEFLAGETVTVRFAEMDAGTSFKRYSGSTVATASGFSVLVDETADEVYATNGLNGSSYESTFSPDFVANYIILDTNTDFSGKAAYAYFCYTLTTSNGMYRFWGGVTALDVGNYRVETDTLNLYFDESAGFVKQTDDVRIFRKDGVRPALDPTTGGNGIEMNWRVPVSVVSTGGSAMTPTESAHLMSLANAPAASTVADAVWSKTLP